MPDQPDLTPRDLFLAPALSADDAARYLERVGFGDGAAADGHLQQLAESLPARHALGELAEALLDALTETPDPDAAVVGFCRYVATRTPTHGFLGYLRDDPRALELLTTLVGTSPFLGEILIRNPEYLHWVLGELRRPAPDRVDYQTALDTIVRTESAPARRIDALKRFQRRETLRVATRDLLGVDTLTETTEQLSLLADTVTEGALRIATAESTADSGPESVRFAVIGMGKLGGRELNYSSDIDLIYIYEAADGNDDAGDAHRRVQKLGRRLTALLGEHTAEGYCYRVDLRLRPMGPRGALVYSLAQCAQYYEGLGETFERFALIKARPIAGDPALGARFVDLVRPFVYRRYLDLAAIEELARYKARADREHATHGAPERDVKQGRGGIREIELFTQVFQLIYGGDKPGLQHGNTLAALAELTALAFIESDVARDLADAYTFLRTVEHRLQMVQDSQTHSLSASARELTVTARRLGFDTAEALLTRLAERRERVHAVYAELFEQSPEEAGLAGRDLFRLLTGEMTDDEARTRLGAVGFRDTETALEAIRALDAVPSHAHAQSTSRNLLANLLARMLDDGIADRAPARVINRFERVVARAGAPAALYRTLLENDTLRRRLLHALDAGDLFAERLSRYPELLDFLAGATLDLEAFRAAVTTAFDEVVATGADLEARLDPFRRVKAIEELKVLIEWLTHADLDRLTGKLSLVADIAVRAAAGMAARARPPGDPGADTTDGWVAVALGKLGGRELTVHSDLDLVFLYRGDTSDATRYQRHQKFVRTIYDVLSQATAAGTAYELDTRLRPEGKTGALAIPLVAFERYTRDRAEIWERMAWTRCRFVAGDRALADELATAVARFVYGAWSPDIPAYARHVRGRIEQELAHETAEQLDIKRGHGGLADIDFLLQVLQIREGATREEFRVAGTRRLLAAFPATDRLEPDEVETLREAYALLRELETVLRIDADASVGTLSTDPARLDTVARRLHRPMSGDALLALYRETTTRVRAIYDAGMTRLAS